MSMLDRFNPRRDAQLGGALTSGVDYFGKVGKRNARSILQTKPQTTAGAGPSAPRGTSGAPSLGDLRPADNINQSASSLPDASNTAVGVGFQTVPNEPGFNPQDMSTLGGLVSLGGALVGSPEAQFGGATLGNLGQAGQGNFGPIVGQGVSMLTGNSDLGRAAGMATTAAQGGFKDFDKYDAASLAASNMVPGYGAANMLTQALTSPTLGGDLSVGIADIGRYGIVGNDVFGNVGPIDAAQGGKQLAMSGVTPGQATEFFTGNAGALAPSGSGKEFGAKALGANDAYRFANDIPASVGKGTTAPLNLYIETQNRLAAERDSGTSSGGTGTTVSAPTPAGPTSNSTNVADYSSVGVDAFGGSSSDSGSSGGGSSGGDSYGSTDYGGLSGGADYGWKDGGLIDMPGLTKRYADGGLIGGAMYQGYAAGGQVAMGGQPDVQQMQAQIGQMMRDPQRVQKMLARPVQLMQSGELTPDEVVTMGRVAEAAMYNPSLYPQLRQFVAAQGMTPLPPSFDQSVILNIIVISRALQQMMGNGGQATQPGQVPPMDQAQMVNPVGMREGGAVFGPGTGRSDSIGTVNRTTQTPVSVANGEYVIPEHVVRAKGRDFFDGLLRKYTQVPKGA